MYLCPGGIHLFVEETSSQWPHCNYIGYLKGKHPKTKRYPEMSHQPLHNVFSTNNCPEQWSILKSPPIYPPGPHLSIITFLYKRRNKGTAQVSLPVDRRLPGGRSYCHLHSWAPPRPEVGYTRQVMLVFQYRLHASMDFQIYSWFLKLYLVHFQLHG